jgi:hypothetical protein
MARARRRLAIAWSDRRGPCCKRERLPSALRPTVARSRATVAARSAGLARRLGARLATAEATRAPLQAGVEAGVVRAAPPDLGTRAARRAATVAVALVGRGAGRAREVVQTVEFARRRPGADAAGEAGGTAAPPVGAGAPPDTSAVVGRLGPPSIGAGQQGSEGDQFAGEDSPRRAGQSCGEAVEAAAVHGNLPTGSSGTNPGHGGPIRAAGDGGDIRGHRTANLCGSSARAVASTSP